MLNAAASLRQSLIERAVFDPTNQEHLESLDAYLRTGNWGAIQFLPELPFVEVPITVLTKFAMHQRKVHGESAVERAARISQKTNLVQFSSGETSQEKADRLKKSSEDTLQRIKESRTTA